MFNGGSNLGRTAENLHLFINFVSKARLEILLQELSFCNQNFSVLRLLSVPFMTYLGCFILNN